MNTINLKINLNNNNNKFSTKEKVNSQDKLPKQKKNQASCLEILSCYAKANINFKGAIKQNDEFDEILEEFENKLRYGKDEKGNDLFPQKELIGDILLSLNINKDNLNLDFARELCYGKDEKGDDLFPQKELIGGILLHINKDNLDFAREFCYAKDEKGEDLFSNKDKIARILSYINDENDEFIRKLCYGKDENGVDLFSQKKLIANIIENTNEKNIELARELCIEKDENGVDSFPQKELIKEIISNTNDENCELAQDLCLRKDENGKDLFLNKDEIFAILHFTNTENIELARELCIGKDENGEDLFPNKDKVARILDFANTENIELARQLCYGKDKKGEDLFHQKELIADIIENIDEKNIEFARELCFGKDENGEDLFPQKELIKGIIKCLSRKELDVARWLFVDVRNGQDINEETLDDGKADFNKNLEFVRQLCFGKDEKGNDLFPQKELIKEIILNTNDENRELAWDLCLRKDKNGKDIFANKAAITDILRFVNKDNIDFALELTSGKDENGNELFTEKELIGYILLAINKDNIDFARQLCFGKDENGNELFTQKKAIKSILVHTKEDEIEITKQLALGKNKKGNDLFPDKSEISSIMMKIIKNKIKNPQAYIDKLKNCEITPNILMLLIENDDVFSNEIKKLKSALSMDLISELPTSDLYIAIKMIDVAHKKDIDEIDKFKKKAFMRNIMSFNVDLYDICDELKAEFPLLPSNNDEYCSLMQKLSKSVGIETNNLTQGQSNTFYTDIAKLANSLADISDIDFNMLEISQEYPREEFIKNTFKIIKDLTPKQQQKVCDCFGFELKRNKYGVQVDENPKNVFSIVGYPQNLKNREEFAKIEDINIKTAIEKMQPEVARFCKNNSVICSNKKIKPIINEILNLCPELKVQIGKTQYRTYDFDTFKHSLKTMQKVAQNPEFSKMDKSDKKVLLMASLLCDCNKAEGYADTMHPNESAFDAFYIAKKIGFDDEEINKLHSLIKTHEWLSYTNSKNEDTKELEQRLKLVAYDLHQDNLFEMAKILTEANLKAVRENDDYYDKFETLFKVNSAEVEKCVKELKSTQPLLPIAKIPNATRIKEAIKIVNSDGTTNLKGVYQDKNGMVIIKYNEVENETWEKIGFAKGSISKGINDAWSRTSSGVKHIEKINTGNIKFLAHGLDYQEQIRNFDAFGLVDSDALLSVSYMERPESKYRLFRIQGLLLDVDTKYIHGGGSSDSGSGCKKTLDFFKRAYAFSESYRYSDRIFVAELIKDALNFNNKEYIEFVKNNKNKSITEIQPKEYQEALIKAFATINSNKRLYDREYNEMYVTNPKVMGVFAYPIADSVGDVMDFVKKQKDFLKKYALEKNIPFVIFGD